jgi:hypothetical protein
MLALREKKKGRLKAGQEEGRKDRREDEKEGVTEERNGGRKMERMEEICNTTMHNEFQMQKMIQCNDVSSDVMSQ